MKQMLANLVFALCLAGCVVETNDGGPPPLAVRDSGSLVIDWTIDGTKNPDQCNLSGSSTLDVTVTASNGAPAGEYQQACNAFATTIRLAPGRYSAEAVLLDSAGRDRTTPVSLRPFDIFGDDELSIPIEFPASSFYSP